MEPTVKFGGGSVMVWGCISWWGVGPLVVIEGTLNQDRYINLMDEHLLLYLNEVDEQCHGVIFQDDNAPCHVAGRPTRWRQAHGIRRLPWPAQSPDLNPIEHLWDHLDRQVRKRTPQPTSSAAMAEALQDEWGKIPLSVVRKLISSMPKRIQAVLKAGGLPTPY
jgi:transposase